MDAPKVLGHFRLIEKLGEGGMGVVYRAEDERLQRVVAVKVLRHDVVTDEEAKKRLLREARAAAAVAHANIATIFEVGDDAGAIYVAMELVEGMTLRRRLRIDPPDLRESLRIAKEIAAGLSRAHEKRIVHRDIKPDNVMITARGEVKILDFGLAKSRESASGDEDTVSRLTQEGDMLGTPAYMAPEQVTGDVALDERADVFAFGVLLYEMIAKERPFKGGTAAEVVAAVLRDEPAAPSSRVGAIPAALETVVLRCLEKRAADRFASAREVLEALERVEIAKDTAESAAEAPDAEHQTLDAHMPSSRRAPIAPPPKRGSFALRATLAAVVIAGTIAGAYWTQRGPDAPSIASASPSASVSASAKAGVGILDLPPPACNAAASTELRAGLRAQHGIGWSVAEPHYRAATKADPECAEAYLRLAILTAGHSPSEGREAFQRARSLRARLGERERAIVDAQEPVIARDPPDFAARRARYGELAERFPGDAEIQLQTAVILLDDRSLARAERARTIDPGYADAHQVVARLLHRQGDIAGAQRALEACKAAAPAALDCVFERIKIDLRLGDCASVEASARAAAAAYPNVVWPRVFFASALAGQGATRVLVTEVLQPYWANLAPEQAYISPYQRANIAALFGDFAGAAEELAAAKRIVDPQRDLLPHAAWGVRQLDLLAETGDAKGATRLAAELAGRIAVWSRSPIIAQSVGPARHFEPRLVAARPQLSAVDRERELAAWRSWGPVTDLSPASRWALGDAMLAGTEAAAREALARMPPLGSQPAVESGVDALTGRALLLGGRFTDAIAPLQAATLRCDAVEEPFVHTQAHLWLGQALEAQGEIGAACKAYGVVLRRWGAATSSVTAAAARKRAAKLACPSN
ncbi:MAG: protein kinase [Labilithrix sp.]|nr:protein kinase [Labilithrix sp.]